MLADLHVHSHFSGDCKVPMEDMIRSAINKKLDILTFTDHHDLDYPPCGIDFTLDIDTYVSHLTQLKEKYAKDIDIRLGIELGLQPHLHKQLKELTDKYPFDFIIGSNHMAKGFDVYYEPFWSVRTQQQAYIDYFEDMLENVKGFKEYCSYGHLDYVVRYGNFENKFINYSDYQDLLDEILKTIIADGKGIEINTSGYKYRLDNPHPNHTFLKRYKELGGEIITMGSDAHMPENIARGFERSIELLKSIGFKYIATYKNCEVEFHCI